MSAIDLDTDKGPPMPRTAKALAAVRRAAASHSAAVAARTVAAIVGGYGVSAVAATVMAVTLPLPRSEAVVTGMLVAILVFAGVAMWAFAAKSVLRVWLWLAGLGAAGTLVVMLLQRGTTP